jgi:hypothetical protein
MAANSSLPDDRCDPGSGPASSESELKLDLVANRDPSAPNFRKLRLQSPRLCDCSMVGGDLRPASALIEVDRWGVVVRRDQPHPSTGGSDCHRFDRFQESSSDTSPLFDSDEDDDLTLVAAKIIEKHTDWRSASDSHETREFVGLVQYTSRDDPRRSKMLGEQSADPRLVFRSHAANIHQHSVKSSPIRPFALPVAAVPQESRAALSPGFGSTGTLHLHATHAGECFQTCEEALQHLLVLETHIEVQS